MMPARTCAAAIFGALVAATAAPASADSLTYYRPPGSTFPLSEAVQAGDLLILSGQIGVSKTGDFGEAAHSAMDRVVTVLKAHGSDVDHVVKCTILLADMKNFAAFNPIYASYFKPDRLPARTAMGVAALAGGAQLEVECWAYHPVSH